VPFNPSAYKLGPCSPFSNPLDGQNPAKWLPDWYHAGSRSAPAESRPWTREIKALCPHRAKIRTGAGAAIRPLAAALTRPGISISVTSVRGN